MNIAHVIDHTFLEPTVTIESIATICNQAKKYQFRAVCIPPLFVKKAKEMVDEKVKVVTVIGFPFGYSAIEAKLAEAVLAIVDGADEIDLMANLSAIKNTDWQFIAKEINTIMPVIKSRNRIIKVILEVSLLTTEEIRTCCDIYGAAGVDAIKTSTGYSPNETTVEHILQLRKYLAEAIGINAGPASTFAEASAFLSAGAKAITTSNGINIVKDAKG
jgi:deoxyribose-phosphate aldolase